MDRAWNHMYEGFLIGVYPTLLECVEAVSYLGGACFASVVV